MSSRDLLLIAVALQMDFVYRLVKMQHSKEGTFWSLALEVSQLAPSPN
jgi:hypothetical protein